VLSTRKEGRKRRKEEEQDEVTRTSAMALERRRYSFLGKVFAFRFARCALAKEVRGGLGEGGERKES